MAQHHEGMSDMYKTYRIETMSGQGLQVNVDAEGYDTSEAAEAMAEEYHPGGFRIVEEPSGKVVTVATKRAAALRPVA